MSALARTAGMVGFGEQGRGQGCFHVFIFRVVFGRNAGFYFRNSMKSGQLTEFYRAPGRARWGVLINGWASMRTLLIILAMLLCGCNRPTQRVPVGRAPQPTILDEALAKYSNAIAQAQQELPTDKWEEKPFRHNASRDQRVSAAAKPMFEEIKLRLKGMSVSNLVASLKLIPYPYGDLTNNMDDAAECVYAGGNWFIMNEIKGRPPGQLRGLEKVGTDKFMLVEGPQGFGLPLTYDLEDILYDHGLTNRLSR